MIMMMIVVTIVIVMMVIMTMRVTDRVAIEVVECRQTNEIVVADATEHEM